MLTFVTGHVSDLHTPSQQVHIYLAFQILYIVMNLSRSFMHGKCVWMFPKVNSVI